MAGRGHDTIEHTADMGIHGWAPILEEALEEGARAMFELSFEGEGLTADREIKVSVTGRDRPEIMIEFLNELLSVSDREELALLDVNVTGLKEEPDGWSLEATAGGVSRLLHPDRLLREIKGATWYGTSVKPDKKGGWSVRCVLDL